MRQAAIFGLIVAFAISGCNRPDSSRQELPETRKADSTPPAPAGTRKAEELVWARTKAEAFLRALIPNPAASSELLADMTGGTLKKQWYVGGNSDNNTSFVHIIGAVGGPDGVSAWEINSERIAPDKDEALFQGLLKAPKESKRFTLAITKEADGKWRVSGLSVERAP